MDYCEKKTENARIAINHGLFQCVKHSLDHSEGV